MNILFLDLDGVLNSTRTVVAFGGHPLTLDETGAFDRVAIHLVQALCRAADVRIVLSSSWRVTNKFHDVGVAFGLPIIDRTPHLPGSRGSEIARWLAAHPEVEQYAIVDDEPDMLPEQESRFVRTDGNDGLRWGDYVKLCALFGANPHDGAPRDLNRDPGGRILQWDEA